MNKPEQHKQRLLLELPWYRMFAWRGAEKIIAQELLFGNAVDVEYFSSHPWRVVKRVRLGSCTHFIEFASTGALAGIIVDKLTAAGYCVTRTALRDTA